MIVLVVPVSEGVQGQRVLLKLPAVARSVSGAWAPAGRAQRPKSTGDQVPSGFLDRGGLEGLVTVAGQLAVPVIHLSEAPALDATAPTHCEGAFPLPPRGNPMIATNQWKRFPAITGRGDDDIFKPVPVTIPPGTFR